MPRMWRRCLPTLPVTPVSGRPDGGATPVVPVGPVGPVAPVVPWEPCGPVAVPPARGPAAPFLDASLEPAGLHSERSVVPPGQTEGSYGGSLTCWLMPGWFGPSHETHWFACRRLVVVPVPSLFGTPIVWFPGGGLLSAGLSPAL